MTKQTGTITQVVGVVVDVEFDDKSLPSIFDALKVQQDKKTITLEVAQHLGDNLVRAIALQPTDGLVRGAEVTDTGGPITVPVGDVTKGHVFNTLGQPLDVPESQLQMPWSPRHSSPSIRPTQRSAPAANARSRSTSSSRSSDRSS